MSSQEQKQNTTLVETDSDNEGESPYEEAFSITLEMDPDTGPRLNFLMGGGGPSCGYFLYPDGRVCAWSQNWWVRKTVWNVNGALYYDPESECHNKHTDSVALLTEPPTGGFQYSWDLLLESHPEWEERLLMADEDEQHSENSAQDELC